MGFGDNPCISRPENTHQHHASSKGQIAPGSFEHQRSWSDENRKKWTKEIREQYLSHYRGLFLSGGSPGTPFEDIRETREAVNKEHSKLWKGIRSYKTCLSCLQGVPDHVLECGHSYCPRCIQELGCPRPQLDSAWYLHSCKLCWLPYGEASPHCVQLKPRCAGARILTLDGGGVRGIVELCLLQAIANKVDLALPIKYMFDLIVGTSTGKCITLIC